jgi:hypothetical protein
MAIKINNEEISECFYRAIFDGLCAEYKSTPLEEKEKILEELIKNKIPLKVLALKMLDYCNNEANKDIKMVDIVFGLADLLEEIIKRKNS